MPEAPATTDVDYHLRRARWERNVAYRSADEIVADAHMRLSALHLGRALLLQAVRTAPLGNVHPFRPSPAGADSSVPLPILQLPSAR